MNPYIELHGADHGETILVAVAAVQGVVPISALQVARGGAPAGSKCQIVFAGTGFFVKEDYATVKQMLVDLTNPVLAVSNLFNVPR